MARVYRFSNKFKRVYQYKRLTTTVLDVQVALFSFTFRENSTCCEYIIKTSLEQERKLANKDTAPVNDRLTLMVRFRSCHMSRKVGAISLKPSQSTINLPEFITTAFYKFLTFG